MNRISRLLAALLVLAAGLVAPGRDARAQDGSLRLCLAAAADLSPVYPTEVFPAGTTLEVTAVFRVPKGRYRVLGAEWIAADVGQAAPPNYAFAKGRLALKPDTEHGVLRLTGLKTPLPSGKYRLEVMADDKPWRSIDFTVAVLGAAPAAKTPADFLPLKEGAVWTYAFVQQAGAGGKGKLPGVKLDADGKYRATVTLTAAKPESVGLRIETRRDGRVVFEEWWRLDQAGLSATRRKTEGKTVTLDPPQVLLPFPPKAPAEWHYAPKDRSYTQASRLWGPLPVKGPGGEAPGWVVLTEQSGPSTTVTAERHFLPGVGMVKEVNVTALGGEVVSRQELVLTEFRRR